MGDLAGNTLVASQLSAAADWAIIPLGSRYYPIFVTRS